MSLTKNNKNVAVPSLYTALAAPPRRGGFEPSEEALATQLASTLDHGVPSQLFHDMQYDTRRSELRHQHKSQFVAGWKGARAAKSVQKQGGDNDSSDDAGIESVAPRKKKRAKAKHIVVPEDEEAAMWLATPDVEVPPGFPSGDLLSAILAYSTSYFSASHLLLPPLSTTSPFLPPTAIAQIESLKTQLAEHDEAIVRDQGPKHAAKISEMKKSWGKKARGEREGVWTDVERAFEPSALVALSMLLELLVADQLLDPALHPNWKQVESLAAEERRRLAAGESVLPNASSQEMDEAAAAAKARRADVQRRYHQRKKETLRLLAEQRGEVVEGAPKRKRNSKPRGPYKKKKKVGGVGEREGSSQAGGSSAGGSQVGDDAEGEAFEEGDARMDE
ncbi:hypothetical protein MNV49_006173 [Pseudohyphozyma bogoriensis]|nr:hypothetical protein MNV49_006173 [Pseudohyphozyma bogoriensis]